MFKPPRWFYTFVPFKVAAGCSSPLIPLLVISLGGTAAHISLVSSTYSVTSMAFLIIWGKFSDAAQKRKPFLVLGFSGFALALLLFSQAHSLPHLLYIQVLSAVSAAATIPVSSVYLLQSTQKEYWDQAIGEFNRISGYAWALGLLFGTFLLIFLGISYLFILLGIICALSALLFQKSVKEKPVHINRDEIISFANIITEKLRLMPSYIIHFPRFMPFDNTRLKAFYLASFVLFVSSGLIFTPFVYFLTEKGASTTFVFFTSFVNALISAYAYSKAAKKVALFGGFSILGKGLLIRGFFFLVLVAASVQPQYLALALAVVCYSVFGYTWAQITISSNSVMARLAVKGKEGKIMGMYNFMASLGLITGNTISGVIVDTMGFTAEFLLGFTVIILSIFWIRKIKNKEDSEMKIKVKTAFEKTMLERKKWWNLFTYQKIDSYLEMAGVQKGWNALDVAAGDGIVAYRLAKKGCTVTAMDISPALLFHRSTKYADYIVEDAEKMDYKKEFDIITCRNAFHYFPNPLLVLQKMRNALKTGGVLLLMEPIATTETYPFLKRLFEKKAPVRNFFTKEELVDMIVSEDFVVVTTRVDEYTNWVKTDTDIKTSVTTLLKDGVLYFTMDDGYLVLVAKKRLKIIL